jgi:hypothetical protein
MLLEIALIKEGGIFKRVYICTLKRIELVNFEIALNLFASHFLHMFLQQLFPFFQSILEFECLRLFKPYCDNAIKFFYMAFYLV